jgi:phenylacetate-coenzyme A ligase PaaK-like adenylate-forming protein
VYTHLGRTSQPMIRLISGDRARWTDDPCPCGRTYPRLPAGIYGRFDDMLVVRGENVYPSGIEDALRAVPGFGGEFRVIVSRRDTMDELLVRAEYTPEHEPADRAGGVFAIVVQLRICVVTLHALVLLERRELMKVAQELKEPHIARQIRFAHAPKYSHRGLQQ